MSMKDFLDALSTTNIDVSINRPSSKLGVDLSHSENNYRLNINEGISNEHLLTTLGTTPALPSKDIAVLKSNMVIHINEIMDNLEKAEAPEVLKYMVADYVAAEGDIFILASLADKQKKLSDGDRGVYATIIQLIDPKP